MMVKKVHTMVAELAVEAGLTLYDLAVSAQLKEVLFLLDKFLDQPRKTVLPCDNPGVHDRRDHKARYSNTQAK